MRGKRITGRDMIQGDASTGKSLLNRIGNAISVSISGNGNRAAIVDLNEGGTDVLCDGVRIAALRDLTVLDVPPYRSLSPDVLGLG